MVAMQASLATAGALQRDLCTSDLPPVHGLDVAVLYRPAEIVSGDTYGIVRLDDRRVAFFVMDATGHGVAASLLATYAQQALRRALQDAEGNIRVTAAGVLEEVNRALVDAALTDCQFVAGIVAIYDESTGRMRLARGGAPYPLLAPARGATRHADCSGPLLGALADPIFKETVVDLAAGDTLILHSDGLNEALAEPNEAVCHDVSGATWSRGLPGSDPKSACVRIDELCARRTGCDDLTMLVLRADAGAGVGVVAVPA